MTPVEPNINIPEGWRRVVFAENQKEYLPLPGLYENAKQGHLITKWKLNWRERLRLFITGNLWLTVMTFHHPLQPILLQCSQPEFNVEE